MPEQKLDQNKILLAEFNHAANLTFRADEDRIRVFRYYLATVGTLIATLILVDLTDKLHLIIFGLVFAGLAVLGVMSLLKLAKLRLAWIDSVLAMHQIKNYYIQNCKEIQLEKAFRWKDKDIPSPGKKWTVAFLMVVSISFLSSFAIIGTILFLGLAITGKILIAPIFLIGLIFFIVQILIWSYICPNKS